MTAQSVQHPPALHFTVINKIDEPLFKQEKIISAVCRRFKVESSFKSELNVKVRHCDDGPLALNGIGI